MKISREMAIDCIKKKKKWEKVRAEKVKHNLNGDILQYDDWCMFHKCKWIIVNCNSSSSLLCVGQNRQFDTYITCIENQQKSRLVMKTRHRNESKVYNCIHCAAVMWYEYKHHLLYYTNQWLFHCLQITHTHTQFHARLFLSFFLSFDSSFFSSSFSHHLFIFWIFLWAAEDCSLISIQNLYYKLFTLDFFPPHISVLPNRICGCCRFVRTKCDKSSPNVDFIRFCHTNEHSHTCHRWWLSSRCA